MLIALAIVLIAAAGLLGPLGSRYTSTRRWLLRVMPTPGSPRLQHGLDRVLVDRWLVLPAVITPLLTVCGVVAAFVFSWWAAIAALGTSIYLVALVGRSPLIPRDLEWYLARFLANARRVAQDCARASDAARLAIAEPFAERLAQIHDLYRGSHVRVPSVRVAELTALGDVGSLLRDVRRSQ